MYTLGPVALGLQVYIIRQTTRVHGIAIKCIIMSLMYKVYIKMFFVFCVGRLKDSTVLTLLYCVKLVVMWLGSYRMLEKLHAEH